MSFHLFFKTNTTILKKKQQRKKDNKGKYRRCLNANQVINSLQRSPRHLPAHHLRKKSDRGSEAAFPRRKPISARSVLPIFTHRGRLALAPFICCWYSLYDDLRITSCETRLRGHMTTKKCFGKRPCNAVEEEEEVGGSQRSASPQRRTERKRFRPSCAPLSS